MSKTTDKSYSRPGFSAMCKSWLGSVHEALVFNRRVKVLIEKMSALVPTGHNILDVGTGDGQIAKSIGARAGGGTVTGIDIMHRKHTHIHVDLFDGVTIPKEAASVDVVTFVDVLHHTDDPSVLIAEAARVAKEAVLIKDHLAETWLEHLTLRVMDWVGNAPHGVVLPYNYASRAQWEAWFAEAGLTIEVMDTDVPLYTFPLSAVFGRKLHFVARLTPVRET